MGRYVLSEPPDDQCFICGAKLKYPMKEFCARCAEIKALMEEIDEKLHRAATRHGGPDYHDREYHGGRFGSGEW